MNELDAVNIMLTAVGSQSVSLLEAGDTNSARAQSELKRTRRSILKHGYLFNKEESDLGVDANGMVPLPKDHLKREFIDPTLSFRKHTDGTLYVWNTETNEFYDRAVQEYKFVIDIVDYTIIPEHFMEWIAWESAIGFYNQIHTEINKVIPAWVAKKWSSAKAAAINSLPTANINLGNKYSARQNTVAGSDAIVNVDGERIRV